MSYSPIAGNEAKIEAELEKRFAEALKLALKENPKLTADEKEALKETVSAELDTEVKGLFNCSTDMNQLEIEQRKAAIRKEIELEIGLSLHEEAMMVREVDMRFQAEMLEKCRAPLYCQPTTAAPKAK